jgi:hypothetical protein
LLALVSVPVVAGDFTPVGESVDVVVPVAVVDVDPLVVVVAEVDVDLLVVVFEVVVAVVVVFVLVGLVVVVVLDAAARNCACDRAIGVLELAQLVFMVS